MEHKAPSGSLPSIIVAATRLVGFTLGAAISGRSAFDECAPVVAPMDFKAWPLMLTYNPLRMFGPSSTHLERVI
jgi:hypothetical protein